MTEIRINNKPGVKISGVLLKKHKDSMLFNCEGDMIWLPNKFIKYNPKEKEIILEKWLYDSKVSEGIL